MEAKDKTCKPALNAWLDVYLVIQPSRTVKLTLVGTESLTAQKNVSKAGEGEAEKGSSMLPLHGDVCTEDGSYREAHLQVYLQPTTCNSLATWHESDT